MERWIIRDETGFEALAAEWNALLRDSDEATVFMRWEWHHIWWQVFAQPSDKLHIITWRLEGKLVGLLPVYRQRSLITPWRVCLRLLGTGETKVDEVVTEYGNLLIDPQPGLEIVALAADYLLQFSEWSHIEMSCLLKGSALYRVLTGDNGRSVSVRHSGLRYRVRLDTDEAAYLAGYEPSHLKRLRRSQRAAGRDGGLTATRVDSEAGFANAFAQLAELNHERQSHKQRKSVFSSPRFCDFHYRLSRRLFADGAVDIVRFQLRDRLLAVLYCFYDNNACYYYQSGFVRRDANRYMPLTLAHLMEMQRNRETGRLYYDFMRGEFDSYKRQFNCETQAMVDVSVYRWSGSRLVADIYRRLRSLLGAYWRRRGGTGQAVD